MNQPGQVTEEKILEAATEVFEEKGLSGSRMQEIADRAGINKALLHYYFRSKDRLFEAVFGKLATLMFLKLFACMDNDLPLEEKLALFYREHIGFLEQHPRLPAFILHEINRHPERIVKLLLTERFLEIRKKLFDQIDAEIQAGRIREIDKMQLLINVVALSIFPFAARGIVELMLQPHDVSFDDFVEQRKSELPLFVINALKVP